MKSTILKSSFVIGVVAISLISTLPVAAIDQGPDANNSPQTNVQTMREEIKTKLADAKLAQCRNREKNINNVMARISDRAQKQFNLFATITERTEKFYADKGITLDNYDSLVAEVSAKKAVAQTAMNSVQAMNGQFKCDGDDPKGVAAQFKLNASASADALKDYKAAVKNLIVGVRSVQSTTVPVVEGN